MENTLEIKENVETTSDQADKTSQETYHVLEFIKEHASAFVAILSGIVAIAAFALNLAAYVYQQIRLNPWHIGGDVIDYWGNRQIYLVLVISAVYFIFAYGIPLILAHSLVNYYRTRAIFQYAKKQNEQAKKVLQDVQKEIKSYQSLHTEEGNEAAERFQQSANELDKALEQTRKIRSRIQRYAVLRIGLILIFMPLTIFPIIAIQLGITGLIEWKTLLVLSVIAFFTIILAANTAAKQLDNASMPKAVRKNIEKIIRNSDEAYIFLGNAGDEAAKKLEQATFKQALNDRAIAETCVKMFLSTTAMVLVFFLLARNDTYKQKDFWIYSDEAQTYVVAYQDSGHCVLKQATLNGDEIIVHTREQLVVSGTVATSQKTFDKVTFEE